MLRHHNVLRDLPENVAVIARARGGMRLFLPPDEHCIVRGHRLKYGPEVPRPNQIRIDDTFPWQQARIFGADRLHDVRYKAMSSVLWRSGTPASHCLYRT